MTTFIILYIAFGISITTSSRTSLVWGMPWYHQLFNIVGYPIVLITMVVKTAYLAVKLTELYHPIQRPEGATVYDRRFWDGIAEASMKDKWADESILHVSSIKECGLKSILVKKGDHVLNEHEIAVIVPALKYYFIQYCTKHDLRQLKSIIEKLQDLS